MKRSQPLTAGLLNEILLGASQPRKPVYNRKLGSFILCFFWQVYGEVHLAFQLLAIKQQVENNHCRSIIKP